MLLNQTNKDFRTEFLLKFTEEIIRNTGAYQKSLLDAEVRGFIKQEEKKKVSAHEETMLARESQKREIRGAVQQKIKEESKKIGDMYLKGLPLNLEEIAAIQTTPVFKPRQIIRKPALRIMEHPLPPTVSYLKPQATIETIDIGNLNILVSDPLVKIIECEGPGESIFVGGIMGRKPTTIKLSQEKKIRR